MSQYLLMAMPTTGVGPPSILKVTNRHSSPLISSHLPLSCRLISQKVGIGPSRRNFELLAWSWHLFFPLGDIPIRVEAHVKDLGERFHYNKSIQLGNVKDKILEAENRAKRLKYIPLDPEAKASMIQASIWPMALYSADTAFLGMTHFQTLRAAALFALVGKCNFASPWLACFSVSKRLLDPLLFVVLSILRSIRRLMSLCRDDAMSIIHLACQFEGTRSFGPSSTLKKYLSIMGWQIHPDASMTGPENFRISLVDDSCSRICSTFNLAWPHFLVSNLTRKGTGDFIPIIPLLPMCCQDFLPMNRPFLSATS